MSDLTDGKYFREMTDKERLLAEVKQLERAKQEWERRALVAEKMLYAINEIIEGGKAWL